MLTRGENPLSLSTKAARYGAVGLVFGLAVLAWPVVQGYRMGSDGGPAPEATDGWNEMRLFGWELATGGAQ
ncbi:hypothetical protein JANAI62_10660 [Jannaschia pagri]|uniref:Uncharacterized protein n=1 Tax=Jannaschia pagri TaxID=2829797 RepID=A0ABQ4NJ52_9RHOB|nr:MULTISPECIES: hypothetical protein [unclassified Jannaschia]GIT90611.1 hypothetical protein JANAI61_10690 [Jannaschia sp. AI_61]GIT94443.1 hypothetical protein JANAI62_10660 [Jannaschia sp. AI_62]